MKTAVPKFLATISTGLLAGSFLYGILNLVPTFYEVALNVHLSFRIQLMSHNSVTMQLLMVTSIIMPVCSVSSFIAFITATHFALLKKSS